MRNFATVMLLAGGCVATLVPRMAGATFGPDQAAPLYAALPEGRFPHGIALVGALPDGLTKQEVERELQASIDAWNDVTCSYAQLEWRGFVDTPADVGPDSSLISFVDGSTHRCIAAEDLGFTLYSSCCPTAREDSSEPCVEGMLPPGTVLLNTHALQWSVAPQPEQDDRTQPLVVDLRSVVTHELGHVLGLGHDGSDTLATMAPRYLVDGGLASLAASDKFKLCAMYPTEESECESHAQCEPFGSCIARDGLRVCEEERGEIGDYCARDHLVCPGSCFVSSPSTGTGYCTAECREDEDCPEHFTCRDTEQARECRLRDTPMEDEPACQMTATGPANAGLLWMLLVLSAAGAAMRRRVVVH